MKLPPRPKRTGFSTFEGYKFTSGDLVGHGMILCLVAIVFSLVVVALEWWLGPDTAYPYVSITLSGLFAVCVAYVACMPLLVPSPRHYSVPIWSIIISVLWPMSLFCLIYYV